MEVLPDGCVQVGKKELMYAGTVGLITYLGGVIFINRKSTTSAKMVMAEVAKTMTADKVSGVVALPGGGGGRGSAGRRECCGRVAGAEPYLLHAGEGVGVPGGHEELHGGFAAVQERSISPRCPGTGNGALFPCGDPEAFAMVLQTGRAVGWFVCSQVGLTAVLLRYPKCCPARAESLFFPPSPQQGALQAPHQELASGIPQLAIDFLVPHVATAEH